MTRYDIDEDCAFKTETGPWIKYTDYAHLLEDFEELKDTNSEMHLNFKAYRDQINELTQKNNRLTALFEMQHKRSVTANKLWQQATGNTCYPDLGELLKWFMEERKRMIDERAEMLRIVKNATDRLREVLG